MDWKYICHEKEYGGLGASGCGSLILLWYEKDVGSCQWIGTSCGIETNESKFEIDLVIFKSDLVIKIMKVNFVLFYI